VTAAALLGMAEDGRARSQTPTPALQHHASFAVDEVSDLQRLDELVVVYGTGCRPSAVDGRRIDRTPRTPRGAAEREIPWLPGLQGWCTPSCWMRVFPVDAAVTLTATIASVLLQVQSAGAVAALEHCQCLRA
jgi:hypothetical protein